MAHTRPAIRLGTCLVLGVWLGWVDNASARSDKGGGTALRPGASVTVRDIEGAVPFASAERCLGHPYEFLEGATCPLERRLFADADDGRLDEHSLLAAALVASGVEDEAMLHHQESQLAGLVAELRNSGAVAGSPRRQAQAVFEFMHRRILHGGYRVDCTDLTVALDEGRFNCVSASVLYVCLAGRFGLHARGLEVPGHAMSRLLLSDGRLDVETTCADWFRLIGDPRRQSRLVEKTTGFRHPAGRAADECREVSGVELVATIYYNRGVDLLSRKRFARAVSANAKALRLDPSSETSRGNLLAALNNWAIALGSSGRYTEAAALLKRGLSLQPDYETLTANYLHVHHQWADELCHLKRFEEALDVLDVALQQRPNETRFHQIQADVCRRWARARLNAGEIEGAFAVFDEAKRRCASTAWVFAAEVAEVNDHALSLLEAGRFEEAVVLLERARARDPHSKLLNDNHRAAVMRWAETAFQTGNYAEAIRRTCAGAVPGRLHESLVKNVRYGYYQWVMQLLAAGRRAEAGQIAKRALNDPFLVGRAPAIPPSLDGEPSATAYGRARGGRRKPVFTGFD